jgi:hypothetical protein
MAEIKHRGTFILGAREWDLSWYTNGRVDIKDKESQKLHTRWNPTEPYGNLGEVRKISKTKEQNLEEELVNIMATYGFEEPFDPVMERLLRDWLKKGHQGLKSYEKFEEMVETKNTIPNFGQPLNRRIYSKILTNRQFYAF